MFVYTCLIIIITKMNQSKIIKEISDMGYNEQLVIKALNTNDNNTVETIELLKNLKKKVSPNVSRELDESQEYPYYENYSSDSDEDPLDILRNNSEFHQTRENLLKMNSDSINSTLKENLICSNCYNCGRKCISCKKQLLENITLNPNMFLNLMTEKKIDNVDTMSCDIYLTEEDKMAIEKMKTIDIPECEIVQAYFACNKDENVTMDFLNNNV